MIKEPFVSDNPFRILCVCSGTDYASLRRKADSAARAASVGIVEDVPLAEVFGAPDLSEAASLVRSLDRDLERRCAFRLMWPLSDEGVRGLLGDRETADNLPLEEQEQLIFIVAWQSFLIEPSPETVSNTLADWGTLARSAELSARLQTLLISEDSLSESDAHNVVQSAQSMLEHFVRERICSEAVSLWESGEIACGIDILKELLSGTASDEDTLDSSLSPIVELAHRLQARVEEVTGDIPDWHQGDPTATPDEVAHLQELGTLLDQRNPAARGWRKAANEWRMALVWQMRAESLRLNHADRNAEALAVTLQALEMAIAPEQKAKLQEDAEEIGHILKNEQVADAYKGIEPIGAAPSMSTINGIGTKLYGNTPFPPDPRRHFAILYFTVAFIPVFPIKRYLVAPGGGNSWHFFGQTGWTKWMKIHLIASLICIAAGCLWVANSPPSRSSYSGSSSYDQPSVDPRDQELDTMKAEIESQNSQLGADETSIKDERAALVKLGDKIDKASPDLSNKKAVHDFKVLIQSYEDREKTFNERVRKHNAMVQANKDLIAKYNGIVDQVNSAH